MSVYSVKHNLAFIHIPKNAGTAIRQTLKFQSFDALDAKLRTERHPAYANHFPVFAIQRLLLDAKSDIPFDGMHKFMVLRNPWARMVSLYRHRMKKLRLSYEGRPRNTPEDIQVAEAGFIPWLLSTPNAGDRILTKMPQMEWGKDSAGELVAEVLRFEDLQWPKFAARFKLPKSLGKVNRGDGSAENYRQFYNTEAREHVARHFIRDILYGDYAF